MLLSHTSSLTDSAGYWNVPLGQDIRSITGKPEAWDSQHAPGTYFRYTNLNFPLVAMASIGGQLVPWLHGGGRFVLHHPFDLDLYLEQIRSERVTYTSAPPAILLRVLDARPAAADLASLAAIGTGSVRRNFMYSLIWRSVTWRPGTRRIPPEKEAIPVPTGRNRQTARPLSGSASPPWSPRPGYARPTGPRRRFSS